MFCQQLLNLVEFMQCKTKVFAKADQPITAVQFKQSFMPANHMHVCRPMVVRVNDNAETGQLQHGRHPIIIATQTFGLHERRVPHPTPQQLCPGALKMKSRIAPSSYWTASVLANRPWPPPTGGRSLKRAAHGHWQEADRSHGCRVVLETLVPRNPCRASLSTYPTAQMQETKAHGSGATN